MKSLEHLGHSHVWNPPNNTNHIRNISNYTIIDISLIVH